MSDQYGPHSSGNAVNLRILDPLNKEAAARWTDATLYTQAQVDALVVAAKEQAAAVLEDMAFHSAAAEVGCFDDGEGAAPALRRAANRIRSGQ